MDYIDQLARLRLSRARASVLTMLLDRGPGAIVAWGGEARQPLRERGQLEALHRLKARGYVKLMPKPGRARFSHLTLTNKGRKLVELIRVLVRRVSLVEVGAWIDCRLPSMLY